MHTHMHIKRLHFKIKCRAKNILLFWLLSLAYYVENRMICCCCWCCRWIWQCNNKDMTTKAVPFSRWHWQWWWQRFSQSCFFSFASLRRISRAFHSVAEEQKSSPRKGRRRTENKYTIKRLSIYNNFVCLRFHLTMFSTIILLCLALFCGDDLIFVECTMRCDDGQEK